MEWILENVSHNAEGGAGEQSSFFARIMASKATF